VNLSGRSRLDEDGNVVVGKSIDMLVESNGDVFMVCLCSLLRAT
jgi:hypothetical protein